jgi:hypothetical protein
MPTTLCSGPVTTSAPIRRSARILAACSTLAVGSMVMTLPPLASRMALTVMACSLFPVDSEMS